MRVHVSTSVSATKAPLRFRKRPMLTSRRIRVKSTSATKRNARCGVVVGGGGVRGDDEGGGGAGVWGAGVWCW